MNSPLAAITIQPLAIAGEVRPGANIAALILKGLQTAQLKLNAGDIVVIASKIIAKAEGRQVAHPTDKTDLVAAQSRRLVASRRTQKGITKVVESVAGPVMAAAGIDASNTEPGTVLLLPVAADDSARKIRIELEKATGISLGIIISDTSSRPWRFGVSDFALGAAGVEVLEDLRGSVDDFKQPIDITVRAIADELASAADLGKKKTGGVPVAIISGLSQVVLAANDFGPGAKGLTRTGPSDWFHLGAVEAVRAALGVAPGQVDPPWIDPAADPDLDRTKRVVALAQTCADFGVGNWNVTVLAANQIQITPVTSLDPDRLGLGALLARLQVAARSENVTAKVEVAGQSPIDL